MDEVLEKFQSALGTQTDEPKTNFEGLYKNWGKLGNQEERRKEILEVQKSNRQSKLDKFRGILELVNVVEENIFQSHKSVYYRPNIYVAGFHKANPTYGNVLMMSEWMIEKPEDFNENWYVVPCPKGVRMLVVASQGITKWYTKFGHLKFECRTALPGGNPCYAKMRSPQCCVLDGFYSEKINTFYILDILAWNSQPMTDGETEFRHYWLQTQLGEIDELKSINKRNKALFSILPKVSCSKDSFNEFMSIYPHFKDNFPVLDGLLFYHKRAHYFAGETPLVGWLYPYMVHEILGSDVTVNYSYVLEKPNDYVNQAEFIKNFEILHAKKLKKSRTNTDMDTSESKNEAERNDDKSIDESQSSTEDAKTSETMEEPDKNQDTKESMDAS